jgi:hypothetical protein
MPYFALFYDVVDDFVARRAPFRAEHLRLAAEAHDRGDIVLAGALAEPADTALIILRCADKSTVRPWIVVVGQTPEITSPSGGRLQ